MLVHSQHSDAVKWKPLLWFVKGENTNSLDYMSDFIEPKSAATEFNGKKSIRYTVV